MSLVFVLPFAAFAIGFVLGLRGRRWFNWLMFRLFVMPALRRARPDLFDIPRKTGDREDATTDD